MKSNKLVIIIVLIIVAIALGSYIYFKSNKSAPVNSKNTKKTETANSKVPTALRPEQTVLNFYDWYLKYQGSPLSSKAYENSDYLTDDFKQQLNGLMSKSIVYDPILCAKQKPETISIHSATISAGLAAVTVTKIYSGQSLDHIVDLKLVGGSYKISGITCN